jgi:SH3-like domain-containing protein
MTAATGGQLRVTDDAVRVRSEPSTSAVIVTELTAGTLVTATSAFAWRRVSAGGSDGWIAATFLVDADGGQLRVTDDGVRLRADPSTTAAIVATLTAGTLVTPSSPYAWRQVSTGGGTGWIAAAFLADAGGAPAPSPTPSPAPGPAPVPGTRYQFEASTPTELQVQDWTCSIRSTMWCLKSIGIAVTPAEAQDALSPRYCNSDVGLLDASGAGIVAVLRDRWGVAAFNRNPVSFDDVAGWAGRCPVALGGRAWGHWTAVRGFDGERLVLANPGGTGPRFGQQTLDRQQFAALGSFSAVVISVD